MQRKLQDKNFDAKSGEVFVNPPKKNSKIISIEVSIGKIKLFNSETNHSFQNYETIIDENYVSQYFLPIRIKKQIIYEQEKKIIKNNFESVKNDIIENLRKKAYEKVPQNMKVDNEEIKISSTNYGNIVTIYLKSSVYLKYNIH